MMLFIGVLLALGFGILLYMHLETRMLFRTKIQIGQQDENSVSFRLAHLSDLHMGKMFVSSKMVRRSILKNSPDCIVLTGDYIENFSHIPRFIKFILDINPHKLPVFLVWGNHDHLVLRNEAFRQNLKEVLLEQGICVLENESRSLEKGTKKMSIVGVDELLYGKPDVDKAFHGVVEGNLRIVLSHNPDMIFSLEDRAFDILLSGHFHGGQIYLPFDFEFRLLRTERLAKMRITRGLNEVLGHKIYIHRGLGNVLLPLRFLSPPEIAFIEIG